MSPSAAAHHDPSSSPRIHSATPPPFPISEKPKTNVQLFGPGDTSPQSTPGSTTSSRTSPTPNRRVPHRCIHDAPDPDPPRPEPPSSLKQTSRTSSIDRSPLTYLSEPRDPVEQEAQWRADAERYLAETIFPTVDAARLRYTAEIVAYETDNQSIGEIVCERAADLEAAAVIMAASGKGRVKEFFIGSVTNYCLHRCKRPVVIYRSPPVVRPGASSRGGKEVNETNGAHAHAE